MFRHKFHIKSSFFGFINLLQAVPFPDDKKQEAKDSFMECAEAESITLDEIPKHSDLKQV